MSHRLSTGGGYGYLSGQHGLVIDNIVQATVITADGSIRTASSTENRDLFYGIRGGGSNFGVVTEFVYKLHDQKNPIYGGLVIFTPDKLPALAKELAEWWPHATEKECIMVVFTRGPDHNPAIIANIFYNGSKAEAEKYTKRFTDIGPIVDTRQEMPYKNMNTVLNGMAEHGRCCWMRGVLMDETSRMLTPEIFDKVISYSEDGKFDTALMFEFLPHGKINAISPHETPYCRHLPGNALSLVQWNENTPENAAKGLDLATKISSLVKVPGEAYGNYSPDTEALPVAEDPVKPNRAKDLFREQYPRMQEIKRKYDPDMLFNKWFVVNPVSA
ncbi:hypothetical protein NM688_g9255 [Phlebia brevispora]|uniref:Uncharacterized protein n=1 Tax=Phlebia brevispora TaxID=194682 RepID=A0ACC1RHQ4_9APHY|nr:hypothetical protein NM688_g9255 [Phlebia brevispora]